MWQGVRRKLRFTSNLIAMVFTVVMVACETITPESTIASFPESTPLPGSTIQQNPITTITIPAGEPVAIPSETLTFTPVLENSATAILPPLSGKPVSSWNGIPIMSDAILGEEKEDGYSYSIKAAAEQVQDYYDTEMPKIGWKFFATGRGETGSLLLMYQKDEKTTTVSIFEQGGLTLVLLIQY